jgi:hypothetical protein
MDLMGMLGGVLQQAESGQIPQNIDQHVDTAASAIGPGMLGDVLSHVFNSNQTPPFGQMLGGLFGQSNPNLQANVLNGLIGAAGPAVLGGLLSGGGLSGLAGIFGGGPPRQLTPEEASKISPQEVQQIAHQVQQTNPGVVDKISAIYANHPTLVKTLGTGAMVLALRKIAEMQQQR